MKKKVAAIFMASIMAFSLGCLRKHVEALIPAKQIPEIRVQQQAQQIPEAEK